MTRLLAGDIGGTNARLVLYEAGAGSLDDASRLGEHTVVQQMYYKNHEFASFTEVLCAFTSLPEVSAAPIAACVLATAGPVSGNRINFTNREGWIIDGRAIREEFGIPRVRLVNDFVAAGYGVLGLQPSEVITLQAGDAVAPGDGGRAPKALVGAGTGLGECFLTPGEAGVYAAFASEGGHVEFAPRSALEEEMLHFLQDRLDLPVGDGVAGDRPRVSVERVVSGKGLENIYEFLRAKFPGQVDEVLDAEYNESAERGRLIGAQKYNYSLFNQALELMFGVYGGEVGNVALKYLPLGGLYVAGGIAPKNVEYIHTPGSAFMRRFLDKGRMGSIMTSIPLHLVMKEDIGLRGAHVVAARLAHDARAAHGTDSTADSAPAHDVPPVGAPTPVPHKPADLLPQLPVRARPPYEDALRNAIADYPLTYAAVTTLTAALTAATVVLAGRVYAFAPARR